MVIKFAVAKSSKIAGNYAGTVSVMTNAEAMCNEFAEKVVSSSLIREHPDGVRIEEVEELKCVMEIEYFTGLTERMVQIGYCCTQVQRDADKDRCAAWFEPIYPL